MLQDLWESKEVIKHLTNLFNIFGNPASLISDRETAFTLQEFSEFLKNKNIQHKLIAVAAAWASGLLERINRFLKSSLKKVIDGQLNWNDYLNSIQCY